MRRVVPVLLLLVSACVAQPPERSPLPDIEDVLPEPVGCQLSVGDPMGAAVTDVLADTPAVGVLEEGDVIVAIDGIAITTQSELFDVMEAYEPGDTITIEVGRGDTTTTVMVTLTPTPTDETRPLIGVSIETALDKIRVEEADYIVEPGRATRPIELGGEILLFDPLMHTWQSLGIPAPDDQPWFSTSTGIYSVTGTSTIEVVDLIGGETVEDDGFRGWDLRRLLGAVGSNLVVLVTSEVADQPGGLNIGVAGFDPNGGETLWISPVTASFGIPVAAYGSLDDSAFLLIGIDAESRDPTGFAVYNSSGMPQEAQIPLELGDAVGWFDTQSMTFQTSDDILTVADLIDGSTTTYPLPQALIGAVVTSVGDGRHVLAVSGRDLLLHDLTNTGDSLPLATNCSVGQAGEPAWGM